MALPLLSLLSLCILTLSQAVDVDLLHSLDGGRTFTTAGSLEGSIKDPTLVLTRKQPSKEENANLSALAARDGFYLLRLGSSTTPVRASCFTATVTEQAEVVVSGSEVVAFNYQVSGPGCGHATSGIASHGSADAQLPSGQLNAGIKPTVAGQALGVDMAGTLLDTSSYGAGTLGGSSSSGSNHRASSGPGSRRGPTDRPKGALPINPNQPLPQGQQERHAAAQPGEPQQDDRSWLSKNWMFVAGGVMVVMNVLGKLAGPPPGQPGAAGAAAGAARRG